MDSALLTNAVDAVSDRTRHILSNVEPEFPFYADPGTGTWETTADGDWCPGHWIGLLWLTSGLADKSTQKRIEQAAKAYTDRAGWGRIRQSLFTGMNYRYVGFRGAVHTGDQNLVALGLRGAETVRALYDSSASVVPVGSFRTNGLERHSEATHETTAAVDAIYTAVGVLWHAATLSDNERYQQIAIDHTETHIDWFLRDNGSVWHKVRYDPETGQPIKKYNQLTQGDTTCWSRGLGWSVAGLVDAYNATGNLDFLEALIQHVDYYRRTTPPDDVPYAELGSDTYIQYRDTSAAVLVTYGLVRLSGDGQRIAELQQYGRSILESLIRSYLITEGPSTGQLREGCYNSLDGIAPRHELIWSLYYLFVALLVISDYNTIEQFP